MKNALGVPFCSQLLPGCMPVLGDSQIIAGAMGAAQTTQCSYRAWLGT